MVSNRHGIKPANLFVALLRGVNVGGNNIISMKSLKGSFEKIGFTNVATYINSGNVIFTTKETDARKIEQKIERMLSTDYKLDSRVVVRSLQEMAKLVASLPKTWDGNPEWRYNVIFLRHTIDSEDILNSFAAKDGIEEVTYRPGALLWSAHISNLKQTSMLKLSSKKIFQEMTVRNLNTTRKLHELMSKLVF